MEESEDEGEVMGPKEDLLDFFKALRTAPAQGLYSKVAEVFMMRRNGTIGSQEVPLLIVRVLSNHPAKTHTPQPWPMPHALKNSVSPVP